MVLHILQTLAVEELEHLAHQSHQSHSKTKKKKKSHRRSASFGQGDQLAVCFKILFHFLAKQTTCSFNSIDWQGFQ